MGKGYFGDGLDLAGVLKKAYAGDDADLAFQLKKGYAGDANGIAQLIYQGITYLLTQKGYLEHDTAYGGYYSLDIFDATHFVLAYTGGSNLGYVKTFSIDAAGGNLTQIDSLQFDAAWSRYNSVVKINNTHFAVAYGGPDTDASSSYDGFIKTFSIDGNFDNITEIDSLEHDTTQGLYNNLVLLDETHLGLCYRNGDGDGGLKIFSIDASADNIAQISSIVYDADAASDQSIIMLSSSILVIAFRGGSSNNGVIKTYSFNGSYVISSLIDSFIYDASASAGYFCNLSVIDNTHFALVYRDDSNNGFIKTFSIDTNGDNITLIDSLQFSTLVYETDIEVIDATHLAVAYRKSDSTIGLIATFSIDANSDNITLIDSLEFDTTGYSPILKRVNEALLLLTYTAASNDAWLKTFRLD